MAALSGQADWYNFSQDTSLHGLRYVHLTSVSKTRRVIWGVLIFGVIGYFGLAASVFMTSYATKSLSTKIQVERANKLTFPTVTICNNNLWQVSYMGAAAYEMGTDAMFGIFNDLYTHNSELPPPPEKYNWTSPELAPIAYLTENSTAEFLLHASHTLEQTFMSCTVFGVIQNCADVLVRVPTDGGYCYQFNSNGSATSTAAGKAGGVQFVLDAVTHEYSTGPRSHAKGFSLAFHDEHEVPIVTELGVAISPGQQINMVLQKSTTERYPPPADRGKANCLDTDKKPNPLHYYKTYSFSACQVECKTAYVLNKCGCRDPLQPPLNDSRLCLIPEMLNCSEPALRSFPGDEAGLQSCNCRDPCNESEYTATLSSNAFPSYNYLLLQGLQDSEEYIKSNWIIIDIFYGKMSYHKIEEELAFTFLDMVANLGGTLGLCMGASLLSIFELFEFCILRLHRFKQSRSVTPTSLIKVAPSPEHKQTIDYVKTDYYSGNSNNVYGLV